MNTPAPTAFRILDRSERVWYYGIARMIPAVLWLGGIGLMIFLVAQFRISTPVALPLAILVFLGPIAMDRSKLLDPVEYIHFGEFVMVKRIVSKRSLPFDRVVQVEISHSEGDEYDDRYKGRQMKDVTIRFRRAWPAKLHVPHEDAGLIADWAHAFGRKLIEPERSGPNDLISS